MNGTRDIASRYYCSSLDTLVPIWEKLYKNKEHGWDNFYIEFGLDVYKCGFFEPIYYEGNEYSHDSESSVSAQQAAAHATAKAVLELNND